MERIKHHYFIYLFCLLNKLTLKGVITYNVNDVQNRNRPQATHTDCLHGSRMDTIILFSYLGFVEQLKYLLNAIKTCHSSYVRKNT